MSSAVSARLPGDADHTVCLASDGTRTRWPEFVVTAGRVAEVLGDRPGEHWALDLDDSFELACALFGCWAAGKTAVLASHRLIASPEPDVGIDGVVCAQLSEADAARAVVGLDALPADAVAVRDVDLDSAVVLYTSGSTGRPKKVTRRLRHAQAELDAFESLWGGLVGDACVYTTVSHRHVYGLLFGVLWPLLSGRAFGRGALEYPEQLLGGTSRGNALVSSPALLKRIGHLPANGGEWRAVFSSGGLLPASAAADSARVLGFAPIEVFGSTETSGVAWRRQRGGSDEAWTLLPDVVTRTDEEGFLEIKSPYSGSDAWVAMGDRVRPLADGGFELLGRGDRIAKIEDKRVSLTEIETLLMESPYIADAAAVALADAARQFIAAALRLSPAGSARLASLGKRAFADELKRMLRARIDAVALPRKLRYVEEIPTDPQGKRTQAEISSLFEEA